MPPLSKNDDLQQLQRLPIFLYLFSCSLLCYVVYAATSYISLSLPRSYYIDSAGECVSLEKETKEQLSSDVSLADCCDLATLN